MKYQVARYLIFPLIISGCANLLGERAFERVVTPQEFSVIDQSCLPLSLQFSYAECRVAPLVGFAVQAIAEGKFESACISLQKARSAADNTALAGLHIWCLLQNNNLSAAQQLLNTAIAEFEVDQHIAYSGALIHEQSGNHELAHSLYSDLFAINNETTVLQACARTALASSQAQRCLDCLDRLLLATDVTPKHLTMRAAAFAQLHRYSESMALLVNMLEDWPNDGELLLQTAFVAYAYAAESSNPDLYVDAARLLRRITELDPQNALVFLSLARCYAASGDFNESTLAFVRCLELEPNNVAASHELSDLYMTYNDKSLAQKILRQLLNQPISPVARQQTTNKLSQLD
jgi:tetratricopeptide (TPR) repeat protein